MKNKIKIFNYKNLPSNDKKTEIIDFLFLHLGKYGDNKKAIEKCFDYALDDNHSKGGFVMTIESDEILGATIVNQTGMEDYIPENIIVYIAVNEKYRGQGLGSELLTKCISECNGDIALHVEKDNPAKGLYEKFGFTNPYLEMRLKK